MAPSRQHPRAFILLNMAGEALGPGTARVYWRGLHAKQRLHSPLGKLHSEGLKLLRESGWEEVANDDPRVPGFAFTTRKGQQRAAAGVDHCQPRPPPRSQFHTPPAVSMQELTSQLPALVCPRFGSCPRPAVPC